jgi:uncharacterized membrane protein HdeD (DUF308 family)
MILLSREATRFSTSLLARGALLVFLGIAAIGWPDDALLLAMLAAASVLASLGIYEMYIALRTRTATPGWMIPMADGAASIGFAILSLVFLGLRLEVTLVLVAIWLVLYATLTSGLALALWPMARTRNMLIAWTMLNLSLALLAVGAPGINIFTVLYVGAGYAVAFGALQVLSGIWIRRVAVPYVAPTTQASWQPPLSFPEPQRADRR